MRIKCETNCKSKQQLQPVA